MNPTSPSRGPYDRLYASRELLWSDEPGRMVKLAIERMDPARALDLGCGDGRNALSLEKAGWTVDGFDISEIAIRRARQRFSSRA